MAAKTKSNGAMSMPSSNGADGITKAVMGAAAGQQQHQAPQDIIRIDEPQKLEDLYYFEEKIYDAGDRSKVFLAKERECMVREGAQPRDVVIKMRKKGFFSGGERVWRSVLTRIMNLKHCENILGVDQIIEDANAYYVVMERCGGGELFDFLLNETDVPERECKRIMREILNAVSHLHGEGLIHRDIKPENVMFSGKKLAQQSYGPGSYYGGPNGQPAEVVKKLEKQLKLIDFDTCQDWQPNNAKAQRIVGTPGYIAPESFRGEYTPLSDLWSIGVILYILMTGDMPFSEEVFGDDIAGNNVVGGAKMEEIFSRLRTAQIDFDCPPWPDFHLARDLCQSLLSFEPKDRVNGAAAALQHPWLNQ